ncbi:MAG: hypothetical protein LBF59_04500, partial [Prevotellaceae bacterium]|nr:hypothetical protein [Prevotellaceae bacterium]
MDIKDVDDGVADETQWRRNGDAMETQWRRNGDAMRRNETQWRRNILRLYKSTPLTTTALSGVDDNPLALIIRHYRLTTTALSGVDPHRCTPVGAYRIRPSLVGCNKGVRISGNA